ncbi:hypothetical protein [Streptomyces kanamyceticus]|uniref:hypothetical protein n=1 Tax=Streptomyces kanamyceticus TaxID=1967 RepID=UPI00123CAE1F|nr:hypothetical protein [Streptomyces kanamyceticus]
MRIARQAFMSATALLLLIGLGGPTAAYAGQPGADLSASSVQAPSGKWKVKTTFFGKNGEDLPLRVGDSNFGYKHIQASHPEPDTSLYGWIDDALDDGKYSRPDVNRKVTVRYQMVTGKWFRVVFTERVDSRSDDGRPIGIITAFRE